MSVLRKGWQAQSFHIEFVRNSCVIPPAPIILIDSEKRSTGYKLPTHESEMLTDLLEVEKSSNCIFDVVKSNRSGAIASMISRYEKKWDCESYNELIFLSRGLEYEVQD